MPKKKPQPLWEIDALELLDRFERQHSDVKNRTLTKELIAEMVGKTRQTLSKSDKFNERYDEVMRVLVETANLKPGERRKKRLNLEQRVRRLERENRVLQAALDNANLRWLALYRVAEREKWPDFEEKLVELLSPKNPWQSDRFAKPEE